ncbi:MAG: prepilin-type N-terminal cleavage/methylation domain-containing protein [Verrucomicrobiales bacterium]|jgi:prepilin-type N-terminal cleavage/methylation domain-containing protein
MRFQRKTPGSRGFSLLELVGVLAIVAILASVMAPPLIQQIERTMAAHERDELAILAQGLKDSILKTKRIPDVTEWVAAASAEVGWPEIDVLVNDWRSSRVYLIDPALRVGPVDGQLPYEQTSSGSIKPESPRILILSSLDPTKALPVSSGTPDAAVFDTIWDTNEGAVPEGWIGRWVDAGDDLKIQRIHLGSLFHRVILNSYTIPRGFCSIDEGTSSSVPASGVSAWFLEGTLLTLFDSSSVAETREIIDRPASFTYESGNWNGRIFRGSEAQDDSIYLANELLLMSPPNGAALPSDVGDAMSRFFTSYTTWDAADFSDTASVPYVELQTALSDLETATDGISAAP